MTLTTTANDFLLVQHALKDKQLREVLLRRLQPKIQQVVRSCTRAQLQVDELIQYAGLEILKSLHTFRGDASLESWASGVAYRVAVGNLQKEHKRSKCLDYSDSNESTELTTPETIVGEKQLFEKLLVLMACIPSKRRSSLLMHFVKGCSVTEVSKKMDVRFNTTKTRLKTGLRELREIMEENPELKALLLESIRTPSSM